MRNGQGCLLSRLEVEINDAGLTWGVNDGTLLFLYFQSILLVAFEGKLNIKEVLSFHFSHDLC